MMSQSSLFAIMPWDPLLHQEGSFSWIIYLRTEEWVGQNMMQTILGVPGRDSSLQTISGKFMIFIKSYQQFDKVTELFQDKTTYSLKKKRGININENKIKSKFLRNCKLNTEN